jgi:hypothetical protein
VILSGIVVPAMAVLGSIFLGVWIVGVVYGAKGDAAAAANARAEAEWAAEQAALRAEAGEGPGAGPDGASAPQG